MTVPKATKDSMLEQRDVLMWTSAVALHALVTKNV